MRSQAFLPLRNEPYDFVVVHAYDDLNKNMTADLNSIHIPLPQWSIMYQKCGLSIKLFKKSRYGNRIQCEKRKLFYDVHYAALSTPSLRQV